MDDMSGPLGAAFRTDTLAVTKLLLGLLYLDFKIATTCFFLGLQVVLVEAVEEKSFLPAHLFERLPPPTSGCHSGYR